MTARIPHLWLISIVKKNPNKHILRCSLRYFTFVAFAFMQVKWLIWTSERASVGWSLFRCSPEYHRIRVFFCRQWHFRCQWTFTRSLSHSHSSRLDRRCAFAKISFSVSSSSLSLSLVHIVILNLPAGIVIIIKQAR